MSQEITMEKVIARMEDLGLGLMAAHFESYLSEKSREEKPLLDSIGELLDLEYYPRRERMAKTRLKVSGIPEVKRLEDYDLKWLKGGLTEKKFKELSSLSFIQRRENVILMGPSGTGKTHLMLALGHRACMNGYTAYHMSCTDSIEIRKRSVNHLSVNRASFLQAG